MAVGPGMVGFGQAMFDATAKADPVEGMAAPAGGGAGAVFGQVGELNSVIGQHGMDAIGHGSNQRFKEGGGSSHVGALDQLHEGELRGAVDGHEEIEFAFSG